MRGYLVASRPLYLPGGLYLYAIGVLRASPQGHAEAIALGALVIALVHIVTHFVNDAEDVETDNRTANPTQFTGGSRAIQRGLVTPRALMRASAMVGAIVVALAIYLFVAGNALGAVFYLAMLALGYAYSGRPFMLGRRGLGEIDTAFVMGVLAPLAGAHAAGGISRNTIALLPLLGVEMFLSRMCTAYPDLEADRATGKRTLAVVVGTRGSTLVFAACGIAVAAAGWLAIPTLPHQLLQCLHTTLVALTAFCVAAIVHTGRGSHSPKLIPMIGLGAVTVSLNAMLLTCLWP